MKYILLIAGGLIWMTQTGFSQELKQVEKKGFQLDVTLNKAEVVSNRIASRANISFDYRMRSGKDYVLTAVVLDESKREVEEVKSESQELAEGDNTLDLSFRFEQIPNKTYTSQNMATQYLRVELRRKSDIGEKLQDLGIKMKEAKPIATYTYAFKKEWRVGPIEGLTVDVILKPIGKAIEVKN